MNYYIQIKVSKYSMDYITGVWNNYLHNESYPTTDLKVSNINTSNKDISIYSFSNKLVIISNKDISNKNISNKDINTNSNKNELNKDILNKDILKKIKFVVTRVFITSQFFYFDLYGENISFSCKNFDELKLIKVGSIVSISYNSNRGTSNCYKLVGDLIIHTSTIDELNGKKLVKPLNINTISKIYQLKMDIENIQSKLSCEVNKIEKQKIDLIFSDIFIDKDNTNETNEDTNDINIEEYRLQLNKLIEEFKILVETVKDDWQHF